MSKIKAIVFDLGMVLIPFNYELAVNRLNLLKPGAGDRVMNFVKENYHLFRLFEAGKLTENEYIPQLMKAAGTGEVVPHEKFCRIYSEIFSINYDVAELLEVLKPKYRLFLLSNTNPVHREYGYAGFEFLQHFEKLFYSDEVGAVKPEAAIYQAVEAYSGLKPEEHLFIDDIEDYINGAKRCGWQGIQFFNYRDLLGKLRELTGDF
jgi:haloacid dehalogenase superfamily, subfamily IA, variant 3 with third motif having DD or ED